MKGDDENGRKSYSEKKRGHLLLRAWKDEEEERFHVHSLVGRGEGMK